jgi:hypothetical protein
MENICQTWYEKSKSTQSPEIQHFFTDFETHCNHAEHELISEADKANYINDYAFYCGLNFGIKNLIEIPGQIKTFKTNILIVDTMNVFQNMSLLIMALCVIEFTPDEIDAIGRMISSAWCEFYTKIAIFSKIMGYFHGRDSSIFFVIQCDRTTVPVIERIAPIHPSDDCQLFKISVPCLLREKGYNVNCYQRNIKNESDDVVSLLLYNIFSNEFPGQPERVTFWTYDNYNWFNGYKDTREINLMYYTNKANLLIELIIGREVYRKDKHTQAKIINFNKRGIYSWDEHNYNNVFTNLNNKYNDPIRIPKLAQISEIYITFIKDYIRNNKIQEDMEDDPEVDINDMDLEGGNFYKKYLKYKNKYLELKNKYGDVLH